jgi:short-subunit dehydrogenase
MHFLNNKLILITGASRGIGKEITLALMEFNTRLLLIARNESALKELSSNRNCPAVVDYRVVDLSKDHELYSFLDEMKALGLEPDILIHCAGVYYSSKIVHSRDEIIDESYKVNFRAPFILTRDSTKNSLSTFAEVLHKEVFPDGVSVTTIYPGRVETPMQNEVHQIEGKRYFPERLIQPREIAEIVLNVLDLPDTVEIKEFIVRPTMYLSELIT